MSFSSSPKKRFVFCNNFSLCSCFLSWLIMNLFSIFSLFFAFFFKKKKKFMLCMHSFNTLLGLVTVAGDPYRKEWCPCRSKILRGQGSRVKWVFHRSILGLGGSTARSPSKAPLILGIRLQHKLILESGKLISLNYLKHALK